RPESEDHLGLDRLVVRLGVGATGEAPGRYVECFTIHGEPARLLDPLDERRRPAGIEPDHAAGALLGDEHTALSVDRDADGTLEPAPDDTGDAPVEPRHSPGLTVRDVEPIIGVDGEPTEAFKSV